MDFLGFLFGILALITVMSIAVVGLGVFGITKIVQTVVNRLPGKSKAPRQIQASRQQAQTTRAPQRPMPQQAPVAPPRPQSFEHFDVDAGATAESISRIMRDYQDQRVIGFYAREVITFLDMAELRKKSLFGTIDSTFSRRSISWDHFASTATEALDAIMRNCALLANRVQSFDVDDYERMERFYRTGGEMRNGPQDPARIKRWDLLRETKTEMDDIRAANEALLLELDKLTSALTKITSTETTDESSRIAQEVDRLVEETKYYQ